jgi:predicted methyltransferase
VDLRKLSRLPQWPTANVARSTGPSSACCGRGGIYYVEDHAAPGTGTSATGTLHRIDPQAVRDEVAAAGFVPAGESPLLANPADPHSARSNDPVDRGHTDRVRMRFRRP